MEIVYIYRSPKMGISIDNVFRPIETGMKNKCKVSQITFDTLDYSLKSMLKNIFRVKKFLKQHRDAIVHITGTENYLIPFIRKNRIVVTVHDLGFIDLLNHGFKKKVKQKLFIDSLNSADKVTFISEKSLEESKRYVKLDRKNITVIENPVNSSYKPLSGYKFNKEKPVVLQVGTKINNKNLERTAEALIGINCMFRIVGPLSDVRKKYISSLGIDFIQKQNLTNEELIKEYQNCDIVTFASLYEGFGLPLIEGQAAGKAVVTSNISPMREVANGSCVLVDPYDVKSIHDGISEALVNHEKYERLGLQNVKRYSVETKVDEYYNVYEELNN